MGKEVRHFIRKNWKRMSFIVASTVVSIIMLVPASIANVPINPVTPPVEIIHCENSLGDLASLMVKSGFRYLSYIKIEEGKQFDTISLFINEENGLLSYLTSKEGCAIDLYGMEYKGK